MRKYAISDSRLMLQYTNGNEEAFATLVDRHKRRFTPPSI